MTGVLGIDDLYLAAALSVAGHFYELERRGSRVRWIFRDPAAETLTHYLQGELQLEARSYADTIRALKGMLHREVDR